MSIKIGMIVHFDPATIEKKFAQLKELGMVSLQLGSWDIKFRTDENAELINSLCKKYGMEISALWCGWSPRAYWNFYEGQETLGLVPVATRYHRLEELMQGADWAVKIGAPDLTTHVGYMPENPYDPNYAGTIVALKTLCSKCKDNGLYFNFETGQETPTTLLRAIEDVGTGNIGINLDPANLILYGKANPCDAMDTFGDYVRGIHVKDATYPTSGKALGNEVRVGDGKANFPKLIQLLNEHKYKGHFTIEREIPEGAEQIADVKHAMDLITTEYNKYNW